MKKYIYVYTRTVQKDRDWRAFIVKNILYLLEENFEFLPYKSPTKIYPIRSYTFCPTELPLFETSVELSSVVTLQLMVLMSSN